MLKYISDNNGADGEELRKWLESVRCYLLWLEGDFGNNMIEQIFWIVTLRTWVWRMDCPECLFRQKLV